MDKAPNILNCAEAILAAAYPPKKLLNIQPPKMMLNMGKGESCIILILSATVGFMMGEGNIFAFRASTKFTTNKEISIPHKMAMTNLNTGCMKIIFWFVEYCSA